MDKKEKQLLHRELETYEDMGVLLYLNGRSTSPKRIEKAYRIAEDGNYMRDYIQDESGKLQAVSFDFVKN